VMGIDNIHLLIDPDADSPQTRAVLRTRRIVAGKVEVSRHVVVNKKGSRKWVFGWDQPLQSFYLQVHDLSLPEDDRIVTWLGADAQTQMYEVEHLVQAASEHGLAIDHRYQVMLYGEKDDGV
jgi:hypothetical protein